MATRSPGPGAAIYPDVLRPDHRKSLRPRHRQIHHAPRAVLAGHARHRYEIADDPHFVSPPVARPKSRVMAPG